MQMLLEGWVSKASAKQRRGRAGRVRPGQPKLFKQILQPFYRIFTGFWGLGV
jgi:HrpA-like RNA helicase